jgi:hypothetical protein
MLSGSTIFTFHGSAQERSVGRGLFMALGYAVGAPASRYLEADAVTRVVVAG